MADTQNPVYTDGTTVSGDGTEEHILAVVNPITPAQLALIPQRLKVSITSAQILHLKATPVILLPAPGPGFMIAPQTIGMRFIAGSAAYVVPATASLLVNTVAQNAVPGQDQWTLFDATGVLDQVAPADLAEMFGTDSGNYAGNTFIMQSAALVNSPLQLTKDAATAEFTAGNGTIEITIIYQVIPQL